MQPRFGEAFTGEEHQPFTWRGEHGAALLIHGFPGTPLEMRPAAQVLHERHGMTVRAPLLPGFGKEIETINERTYDDWLVAMSAELERLRREYRHVVIVGFSMGGALAMKLAAQHTVDGVILFAPFTKVDHILWEALPVIRLVLPSVKIFKLFKPDFSDPQTRDGIRTFMPDADLDDPDVQEAIRNYEMPVRLFSQIRQAGVQGRKAAPKINAPVLVFQGRQDDLVSPERTKGLLGAFNVPVSYHEVDAPHEIMDTNLPEWSTITDEMSRFMENITGKEAHV